MPTPTPQQREFYVASLPVDTPQVPLVQWKGKIAILPNGDEYWCNGTGWLPYGTNSSSVGALDANSLIASNPANLDTPAEIAAAVQAQAAQIAALQAAMTTKLPASVFDKDGDNRLDVDALDDLAIPFTTPSTTWNYTHNLGRIPQVTVLDNTGNEFDADPQFPDLNNITIEFITPKTGTLILH